MANTLRPIVNQRLYFASLHLGWLDEQLRRQQVAGNILEQALGESIVLHLVMAYRSYLRELAQSYQAVLPAPGSAVELAQFLAQAGTESAECHELAALEQRDSWLSKLLAQFHSLGDDNNQPDRQPQQSGAIPLRVVAEDALSLESLTAAHGALRDLIEQQRMRLEEW